MIITNLIHWLITIAVVAVTGVSLVTTVRLLLDREWVLGFVIGIADLLFIALSLACIGNLLGGIQ